MEPDILVDPMIKHSGSTPMMLLFFFYF